MIEELYKKYHQELICWSQSMTGSLHSAEELVQEAFLRAMLHEEVLENLQDQQCRSWLYRTVKNLYVMIDGGKVVEPMEWEELLEALPDMEGVIFSLRYLEGYNSKQIGEMLSLPPGTVRFKLSSARQHLKESLGGKKHV